MDSILRRHNAVTLFFERKVVKDNECNTVVFAKVTMFRPNHDEPLASFGFAKTAEGTDFFLPMSSCRKVVAGSTAPEFSCEDWAQWPHFGDEVVILPDLRPPIPGKATRACRWGYKRYWDAALAEINNRPIYRVVGENRFKGKMMKNGAREEEIAVGTVEELQARFPRGVQNDPLGTDSPYRSGPCQRINRWTVWKNADFVACDDPRPKPNPVAVAVCAREQKPAATNGNSALTELDHELEELARSSGGRRAGTKTIRPDHENVIRKLVGSSW